MKNISILKEIPHSDKPFQTPILVKLKLPENNVFLKKEIELKIFKKILYAAGGPISPCAVVYVLNSTKKEKQGIKNLKNGKIKFLPISLYQKKDNEYALVIKNVEPLENSVIYLQENNITILN